MTNIHTITSPRGFRTVARKNPPAERNGFTWLAEKRQNVDKGKQPGVPSSSRTLLSPQEGRCRDGRRDFAKWEEGLRLAGLPE